MGRGWSSATAGRKGVGKRVGPLLRECSRSCGLFSRSKRERKTYLITTVSDRFRELSLDIRVRARSRNSNHTGSSKRNGAKLRESFCRLGLVLSKTVPFFCTSLYICIMYISKPSPALPRVVDTKKPKNIRVGNAGHTSAQSKKNQWPKIRRNASHEASTLLSLRLFIRWPD